MSYYLRLNRAAFGVETLEGRVLLAGAGEGDDESDVCIFSERPVNYPLSEYLDSLNVGPVNSTVLVCPTDSNPAIMDVPVMSNVDMPVSQDVFEEKGISDNIDEYGMQAMSYCGMLFAGAAVHMVWKIAYLKTLVETRRANVDGNGSVYLFRDYALLTLLSYSAMRAYQVFSSYRSGAQFSNFNVQDFLINEGYGLSKDIVSNYVGNRATSEYSGLIPLTNVLETEDPDYKGYHYLSYKALPYYALAEAIKCGFRKVRTTLDGSDSASLYEFAKSVTIFSALYALVKFTDNRAQMHAGVMNGFGLNRDIILGAIYTGYYTGAFVLNEMLTAYKETFRIHNSPTMMDVLWKRDTDSALHDGIVNTVQYAFKFSLAFAGVFIYKLAAYKSIVRNAEPTQSLLKISIGPENYFRLYGSSLLILLSGDVSKSAFRSWIYSAEHAIADWGTSLDADAHDEL